MIIRSRGFSVSQWGIFAVGTFIWGFQINILLGKMNDIKGELEVYRICSQNSDSRLKSVDFSIRNCPVKSESEWQIWYSPHCTTVCIQLQTPRIISELELATLYLTVLTPTDQGQTFLNHLGTCNVVQKTYWYSSHSSMPLFMHFDLRLTVLFAARPLHSVLVFQPLSWYWKIER